MTASVYYSSLFDKEIRKSETPKIELLPDLIGVEPEIPDFNITKKNYDRYAAILFMINSYKNIRSKICPSIIPISTQGFLLRYFSKNFIFRCIGTMKEIGLITEWSNGYIVGTISKRYVWFPLNEEKLVKILKEKGVKMTQFKTTTDLSGIGIDDDLIRFSSYVRFKRRDDISCEDLTLYIQQKLRTNYPLLSVFQSKVASINARYYQNKSERLITYSPTISFSNGCKWVTGIGIRYNCEFCSYKKDFCEYLPCREPYLKQEQLNLHYDVKGSVPKVSSLINYGVWNDNTVDPYLEMFNEYIKLSGDSGVWCDEERRAMKNMFVRVYFEKTLSTTIAHINSALKDRGESVKDEFTNLVFSNLREAAEHCFGSFLGSEVFFHESNIYIMALEKLLEDGYDVVTCFDSFYARKDGVKQRDFGYYMDNLLEKCAYDYLEMLNQNKGSF